MLLKDQGSAAPSLPERLHHVFHCDSEWHHPLPHPAAARGQGGPAALHLLRKLKALGKLPRHCSEQVGGKGSMPASLEVLKWPQRRRAVKDESVESSILDSPASTFSMAPGLAPAPHPVAGSEPSFLFLALLFSLPFFPHPWSQEHEPCLGLFALFLSRIKKNKLKKKGGAERKQSQQY